ncbi:alpha/beta hydrolase [Candidatus Daviesbacteria bacterium]|nr:alpha/beta hydrolase [Candidatus Daviesbacteria bacterium]
MKQKRVFIIHGWDGYPDEGWFPWLKKELEQNGFLVRVPVMPEPAEPKIEAWVSHLASIVGNVDENTFFVGHSIGCQTILRYLETLPINQKAGGAVFVAGWFTLTDLETEEEKRIGKPWLKTPIDFEKVKLHIRKFFAVFSDNDEIVPLNNKEIFEQKLGAKVVIEHNKGHFSGDDGITELPVVLSSLIHLGGGIG